MKVMKKVEILIIAVILVAACSMILNCGDSYAASGPGKVYNLKASRYTPNQVKLSWDKATGANSYKVYRKVSDGSYKLMRTVDGRVAVFKQTQGKRYCYKVRAYSKGKYGSYSKVKSILLKETKSVNAIFYRCMRIEDNVYCAMYDGIYKYNITTGRLETMCENQAFVDGVNYLDGYLYYESRGNGITNTNSIHRISIATGEMGTLVEDAGSFTFALKDNKIYYSKYKDFKYFGLRTKIYDLESGNSCYDDNILMSYNPANYHDSNDPLYSVEVIYDSAYIGKGYLNTPNGRLLLCRDIGGY